MEITYVDTKDLKPRPNNRNRHPKEQIEQLANNIEALDFRVPLIVSNQSGYIVSGHGRLQAAKKLGIKSLPVIFQDFANSDDEYIFHVSDNGLAKQATLDLSGIHKDLEELGPFDIELLGILDFKVEPMEKYENKPDDSFKMITCPKCKTPFNPKRS